MFLSESEIWEAERKAVASGRRPWAIAKVGLAFIISTVTAFLAVVFIGAFA